MSGKTDNFLMAEDPVALLRAWMADAEAEEINDPNAMSVATMGEDGLPDVRILLLKGFDEDGFVFYTNEESTKGQQLGSNMKAALCFYWKSLRRQVRVRGPVTLVSDKEADDYFATRSRDSQLGAWASNQSRPFKGEDDLRIALEDARDRFAGGEVPRPDHWKGYCVKPVEIEFWWDQPYRLHDRLVFRRCSPDVPWQTERLFP